MIIASRTQFHIERPWGQRPPSRGLLRDYEPSDATRMQLFEALVLCCRVTCEDITERKCISVPELMEDTEVVDKCETVEAAAPSCTMLELELPKQVCKELVYGAAYDHRV